MLVNVRIVEKTIKILIMKWRVNNKNFPRDTDSRGCSTVRESFQSGYDPEIKDLLRVMVNQQAAQTKKLDILENRLESASTKVEQVVLKINRSDKKVFKKKGIEFQYKHNAAVIENYEELKMAAKAGKYELIPQIIDRGMDFIYKRQRTLTFADEKGWVFVEVYEADDIALDSEDDKKIKKAEKRTKEIIDSGASSYSSGDRFNNARPADQNYRQFGASRSGNAWNQGSVVKYYHNGLAFNNLLSR